MMQNLTGSQKTAFGRRGSGWGKRPTAGGLKPRAPAPVESDFRYASEAKEAIAAHAKAEATAERFVAKFNWWLTWVAFGIMVGGVAAVRSFVGSPSANALKTVPLFSFENQLFLASGFVMILIGGVWFVKGLLGRPALVMMDDHVRGFTLFGTKNIRWQDVSKVTVTNHQTYGKEIQIHAKRGTPSSSWFLNCIPLYVGLTDKSADDVLEAIGYFRPDIEAGKSWL